MVELTDEHNYDSPPATKGKNKGKKGILLLIYGTETQEWQTGPFGKMYGVFIHMHKAQSKKMHPAHNCFLGADDFLTLIIFVCLSAFMCVCVCMCVFLRRQVGEKTTFRVIWTISLIIYKERKITTIKCIWNHLQTASTTLSLMT